MFAVAHSIQSVLKFQTMQLCLNKNLSDTGQVTLIGSLSSMTAIGDSEKKRCFTKTCSKIIVLIICLVNTVSGFIGYDLNLSHMILANNDYQ